jgi:hypothetical protein
MKLAGNVVAPLGFALSGLRLIAFDLIGSLTVPVLAADLRKFGCGQVR